MLEERLIIVSGKGGVGKTSIATAIARVCAKSGPTVLVTFDTQHQRHPYLDVPLGYEPLPVGQGLSLMRLDAMEAIREYVRRKVPFSGLYESLLKSRMFRDFAEASPGFEELMCLGKLYDLATGSEFKQVVFDAPATGHLKTLIDVPAATLEAVRVGPLNHNARKIQDLLLDPVRTRVLLAAMPEEMAVTEALELREFCRDRRMTSGPVVLNQWVPDRFSKEEIVSLRGLESPSEGLKDAIDCTLAEFELAQSQRAAASGLSAIDVDVWRLPRAVTQQPADLLAELQAAIESALKKSP
jgi:anion-transporting  ArsA/GET3 family ATPase